MSRKTKRNTPNSPASLVTELYQGTAKITITSTSLEKTIELTLPKVAKDASETDKAAAVTSAFVNLLFSDIENTRKEKRKTLQAEGIARAKAKGTRFGAESLKLNAELFEKLCQAYKNKEITASEAGRQLGCSYRTFQRRYNQAYADKKSGE